MKTHAFFAGFTLILYIFPIWKPVWFLLEKECVFCAARANTSLSYGCRQKEIVEAKGIFHLPVLVGEGCEAKVLSGL